MNLIIKILFCSLFFVSSTIFAQDSGFVVDPYKEEDFSCVEKTDGLLHIHETDSGYGKFRMRADLNFDGKEDIILSNGWCGNATCDASIYLQQNDGMYLKAMNEEFGLHPFAVNLSKIKTGEGKISIYWHMSANEGGILDYKVTSNAVSFITSKTVRTNESEQDEKLYESLFGEDSRLKTEFVMCKNGEIQWSDLKF